MNTSVLLVLEMLRIKWKTFERELMTTAWRTEEMLAFEIAILGCLRILCVYMGMISCIGSQSLRYMK
jgi:hypothetical protein